MSNPLRISNWIHAWIELAQSLATIVSLGYWCPDWALNALFSNWATRLDEWEQRSHYRR